MKSTLGPYGGDLMMVDANGRQTITNDGATVMKVIPGLGCRVPDMFWC
jgi:T-complex protein 1 subunit eta